MTQSPTLLGKIWCPQDPPPDLQISLSVKDGLQCIFCKYAAMIQLYTSAFPQQETATEAQIFAVSPCTKASVSSLSLT